MRNYQPIDCDRHDFLEIACLYHYRLLIELVDGSRLEATPLTTLTTAAKEEFLRVEAANGVREIRLDSLLAITPLDNGATFGREVLTGAA
jgi:Rho-binding antiterminator